MLAGHPQGWMLSASGEAAPYRTGCQLTGRCQLVRLLDNHEEMLLSALKDPKLEPEWLMCGGQDTVNSYRFCGRVSDLPEDHVEFIRGCCEYWETPTHIFMHANYDPDLPLSEMPPYTLRWSPLDYGRRRLTASYPSAQSCFADFFSEPRWRIWRHEWRRHRLVAKRKTS